MGNSSLENNQPDLQQTDISGWVAVTDALPKPLQTVWLTECLKLQINSIAKN